MVPTKAEVPYGLGSLTRKQANFSLSIPFYARMPRTRTTLRPPFLSSLLAAILGIVLTACTSKPPEMAANLGADTPPTGWTADAAEGTVPDNWLASFDDPTLTALVEEALAANPDLAASAARLEAALAQSRQSRARLFPVLNATASANRTTYGESPPLPVEVDGEVPTLPANQDTLGMGLQSQWEVDLWQRLSNAARASARSAQATAADYAYARQSLAAQVAKAYFQVLVARDQLALSRQFVENARESDRIAQLRFRAGDVSAQDTLTAEADLADARSREEETLQAYRQAVRALEILVGRYPADALQPTADLDTKLSPVPAGQPAQILERRPDLVAAERRVQAAFRLARSASAARLPQISLTAEASTSGPGIGDLFDPTTSLAKLGSSLFQPLFDAGLLQAQFEEATAEQRASMESYRTAALRAFLEAEDALSAEKTLRARQDSLRKAANAYTKATAIARQRYQEGDTSLTAYLDSQRQSLRARSSLITISGTRLTNRVDLFLALGGNFASGPIPSEPSPPPADTAATAAAVDSSSSPGDAPAPSS